MAGAEARIATATAAKQGRGAARTPENRALMIALVRGTGTLLEASKLLRITYDAARTLKRDDPAFAADVNAAATFHRANEAAAAGGAAAPKAAKTPPLREFTGSTEDKAAFLAQLGALGGLKSAAALVGVTVASLYEARASDAEFAAGWARAQTQFLEMAQSELLARAVEILSGKAKDAPKAADLRAVAALLEKLRSDLARAEHACATGTFARAADINLEAVRMELEQRLCGLVERYGDPFGDDPARPLMLVHEVRA